MIETVTVRESRLIFVEGIIGSGKSTTASFIARQLQRNGISAHYVYEGGRGRHPTRMMRDLPHPFEPWRDLTTAEYRARVLDRWRAVVARILEADTVAVFDGNLFHGNMTDLLLMDSTRDELRAYIRETLTVTAELNPLLIYLHQDDLEQAIRTVIAERGPAWEQYQVNWKLQSPYAERRGLAGLDGLVALYRDYREITDELVASLGIDTLTIENSTGDRPGYRRQILAYLSLPAVDDTDRSWWPGPPLPGFGVPVDLVRFMTALDGRRGPRLLRPETVCLVEAPPARALWHNAESYYGLGWYVSRADTGTIWGHCGRLTRFVASVARGTRDGRGITRAVAFNTQPDGWDAFRREMGQALRQASDAVTEWPAHDLFDEFHST